MKDENKPILISIIIPVKNAMATIEDCLKGFENQSINKQCEIVIIDSGSTDGTVEYLRKRNLKLIQIEPSQFNHGTTRNLGVRHAKGNFVLMTVQDAWTEDSEILERMLSHFKDSLVAGVVGQQVVPHDNDKNPHEWFKPFSTPKPRSEYFANRSEFEYLTPTEKRKVCGWDNVIALYRRDILLEIPFKQTEFAEDLQWAKDVLSRGYRLIYDYRNRVYHYHHSLPEYVFKRTFIVLYSYYKLFGDKRDLSVTSTEYLKIIYRNFKGNFHPKWILFNIHSKYARHRAHRLFKTAVNQGDEYLEKVYREVCNEIPQGISINRKK